MEYIVFNKSEDIRLIVNALLEQKIYQYKTWRMYEWYNNPDSIAKISLCKINTKIIGAALNIINDDSINASVFVRTEYRRMGIGTKLIKLLELDEIKTYEVGYRKEFWKNVRRK